MKFWNFYWSLSEKHWDCLSNLFTTVVILEHGHKFLALLPSSKAQAPSLSLGRPLWLPSCTEGSRREPVGFPRLLQKRPCSWACVSWDTCSGALIRSPGVWQPTDKTGALGARPAEAPTIHLWDGSSPSAQWSRHTDSGMPTWASCCMRKRNPLLGWIFFICKWAHYSYWYRDLKATEPLSMLTARMIKTILQIQNFTNTNTNPILKWISNLSKLEYITQQWKTINDPWAHTVNYLTTGHPEFTEYPLYLYPMPHALWNIEE